MNGMHRTQFDHARLDRLSLVIWSRVFYLSRETWRKAQLWTIDRCRPHSVTFGYCKFKTLDTVKIVKSFACSNEQRVRRAFGKSE